MSVSFERIKGEQAYYENLGSGSLHGGKDEARDTEKITVWCSMLNKQVMGPHYFDHPLVNGDKCVRLLNSFSFQCFPV